MYNETITYYGKTPVNKGVLDDFDIKLLEENRTCGDDLTVYIKFNGNIIKNWSFIGDTAIITTACASIFGESIIGKKIEEVLNLDYNYIEELVGMPISDKRKKAAILGLLTTRNAIHQFFNDGLKDNFENLIK